MRDIKFRAWHKNYKVMKNVRLLELETDLNPDPAIFGFDLGENGIDDEVPHYSDVELMQYTGFKATKIISETESVVNAEVYEGDILQIEGAIPAEVYWDFGSWQLRNGNLTGGMLANFSSDQLKIIGNVYENPGLLKEDRV